MNAPSPKSRKLGALEAFRRSFDWASAALSTSPRFRGIRPPCWAHALTSDPLCLQLWMTTRSFYLDILDPQTTICRSLRILALIIAGLTGYVFWRIYQSISDLDKDGRDWQGVFNRLGYLGSGLFYALLAITGSKILLGLSSNSTGIKKAIIGSLLESTLGQVIVAIIGTVLVGRAIFQLYFAYSGMYKKRLDESELENKRDLF